MKNISLIIVVLVAMLVCRTSSSISVDMVQNLESSTFGFVDYTVDEAIYELSDSDIDLTYFLNFLLNLLNKSV